MRTSTVIITLGVSMSAKAIYHSSKEASRVISELATTQPKLEFCR
jgi:hypothetical protein